jgi:hypothetical protein
MNDVVDRLGMLLRGENPALRARETRPLPRSGCRDRKAPRRGGDKYEDWSEEDRKMFALLREKGREPLS